MAKDLEKENKKLKKKSKSRGRVVLVLLLILLIIAAVFVLFKPFGFGLGLLGTGTSGSAAPAATTAAATAADTTTVAVEEEAETVSYIDVTIKDATYIFDGKETTAEDIVQLALEKDTDTIVRLHNDNGIIDAYDKLVKALDENNIKYVKDESFDVE